MIARLNLGDHFRHSEGAGANVLEESSVAAVGKRWAGPLHRGLVDNKESGFYSNFRGKVLEVSSGAATVYFHI